jgi:hypothetical protein
LAAFTVCLTKVPAALKPRFSVTVPPAAGVSVAVTPFTVLVMALEAALSTLVLMIFTAVLVTPFTAVVKLLTLEVFETPVTILTAAPVMPFTVVVKLLGAVTVLLTVVAVGEAGAQAVPSHVKLWPLTGAVAAIFLPCNWFAFQSGAVLLTVKVASTPPTTAFAAPASSANGLVAVLELTPVSKLFLLIPMVVVVPEVVATMGAVPLMIPILLLKAVQSTAVSKPRFVAEASGKLNVCTVPLEDILKSVPVFPTPKV